MKRALILIALLALVAPALLFAQSDVTIEGLNDKVHALATDLVILAKEFRRLDDGVTALEADRSIPAGRVLRCVGEHGDGRFEGISVAPGNDRQVSEQIRGAARRHKPAGLKNLS